MQQVHSNGDLLSRAAIGKTSPLRQISLLRFYATFLCYLLSIVDLSIDQIMLTLIFCWANILVQLFE